MLEISTSLVERLCAAASHSPDAELCGLLFGDATRITRAEACANVAADPSRAFEIDPAALFAALRAERAGGARMLGYWHSHPSGDVRPSETDAAMAAADRKLWLIVCADAISLWRAEGTVDRTHFAAVRYEMEEME